MGAWGTVLDWPAFSVRVAEADIPQLEDILRAIPEAEVAAKLRVAAAVGRRFEWAGLYRYERPPAADGPSDALATLMGALYQKAAQRGGG